MDISPLQYLLAILAGIVAGIINTLAGSGSAVTLPMLIFLGLEPVSANATNPDRRNRTECGRDHDLCPQRDG